MKKWTKILIAVAVCVLCITIGAAAALLINREVRDERYGEKGNNALKNDEIQSAQTDNSAPDTSSYIGEERAKEIALSDAGLNAEDVVFEKIKLEKDDGVWQYEVEFRHGRTEYDFDIKAETGDILSRDVDYDD